MLTPRVLVLAFLLPASVCGQTAPPKVAFEVASVKQHEGGMPWGGVRTTGNRLETYSTVLGLMMFAYGVKNDQVARSAALSAVGDQFYYIQANAAGDAARTRDEFRQMVQSLLADRFALSFHREMRETPVYELVVAKNGPKFKEAAADADVTYHVHVNGRNYELTMPKATMAGLVEVLDGSGFVGRHIVEKTGLTGTFEIKLIYTPNLHPDAEPVLGDINILDALQDQLGLKLEPQKAMVEMLVVDHVEKPSVN